MQRCGIKQPPGSGRHGGWAPRGAKVGSRFGTCSVPGFRHHARRTECDTERNGSPQFVLFLPQSDYDNISILTRLNHGTNNDR